MTPMANYLYNFAPQPRILGIVEQCFGFGDVAYLRMATGEEWIAHIELLLASHNPRFIQWVVTQMVTR